MEHILPKSPNPYVKNDADATPAVLGHLNYIIDNLIPYKSYVALISQVGTSAPTAIVLENTLGDDVVFSYNNVGDYSCESGAGIFVDGKTVVFMGGPYEGATNNIIASAVFRADISNTVIINTAVASTGVAINDELVNTPLEIRVYK
jgi:hypothetical protein